MATQEHKLAKVIRRGKRHVLDFGRKWGPRYLSTFRGVPFDTKEVAEAFLHHIELEYSSGDLTLEELLSEYAPPGSEADIENLLPKWIELCKRKYESGDLAPRTFKDYQRWAGKAEAAHFSWWYGRSLFDATEGSIEEWSYDMAGTGLGPKTRANVLSGFSVFLHWAKRHRWRNFELPIIPWPEADTPIRRVLDLETRDKVLGEIEESKRGAFLALAWSGIRPNEVRCLRVKDWRGLEMDVTRAIKDRRIAPKAEIRGPKKRKQKKIRALADEGRARELLDWLEKWVPKERRLNDPDGPLFVNTDPQSRTGWWSESGMKRVWKTACRHTGVDINLYNGTKHSLGAALKAAGADDRVLAEIFGHSDPKSVIPYSEVQTATARAALVGLPATKIKSGL